MDADSTCADNIIEEGVKALEEDPKLGAVCTRCGVLPQPELKTFQEKLLWHLQHLEYGEYDSSRVETTGKIKVAHGLATMFRKEALDGQRKKHGHVYNNESLCEDYWLTMDLKEQGWKITSNQKMKAWTIVPTKLRSTKTDCGLWNQRKRWNLGGIDTIRAHGLSKITMWDIYAHVMSVSLLVAEAIVIGTAIYLMARGEPLYLSWLFYIVLGAMWINGMYRLRYCQNPDKWDILLRITAVPMEIYYHFLMATLLGAYWQYLKGAKRSY
jgi:cellulose synthase/poly-beta-1,6-N-acetylglucosamine synthase-like glycosyltransferase